MKMIELLCNECEKPFLMKLKYYNKKIKNGQKDFYCSRKCFINVTKSKPLKKVCPYCKKEFSSTTHSHSTNFCSLSCSSKYSQSFVNIDNISKSMKNKWKNEWKNKNFTSKRFHNGNFHYKQNICKFCGNILPPKVYKKCCSDECSKKLMSLAGRKSVELQKKNRRSKNEILFADLCKQKFNNILTNKPIFNGWDADVILVDEKIAVLWNGKWHYEKIKNGHSVIQVQNRDNIRLAEIKKMSYTPYIIKDLGKFNSKFVIDEFNKFTLFIDTGCIV